MTLEHRAPPSAPRFAHTISGPILLSVGGLLLALSANRWSVAPLAWLAPVPFLIYARRIERARQWAFLLVAVSLGTLLQMSKIITPPVSPWMAPGFGLPFAFGSFLMLFVWNKARKHAGDALGVYMFASLCALSEWLSSAHSELGAWGTSANTQLNDLPLMQLASLFGIAGIGFLMAWFAAAVELWLSSPEPRRYTLHFVALAAALTMAYGYGAVRLSSTLSGTQHLTVAAVGTELGPNENGFPGAAELHRHQDILFERSKLAAQRGARLIVWNEVATLVTPAEEAAFVERGRAFARAYGVDLVLSYGTLLSSNPPLIDNQYRWIAEDGTVLHRYQKHHPVPGEPSVRGDEPLSVIERPYGRVAGAICYDFDFPALAREYAELGAQLVALPSSDWRGIDPEHTFMARVRAIEGGFSLVRSVRWATSAAFDPYGRPLATMSAWEGSDLVMLAKVPLQRVDTLYRRVGDAPVLWTALTILLFGLVAPWLAQRRDHPSAADAHAH